MGGSILDHIGNTPLVPLVRVAALRVAQRGDVTGPAVAILPDPWDRYFAQEWVKGERPA